MRREKKLYFEENKSAVFIYIFSKILSKIITYLVVAPVLFVFLCLARGLRKLMGLSEPPRSAASENDGSGLNQEEERSAGDTSREREYTEAFEAWKHEKRAALDREKS